MKRILKLLLPFLMAFALCLPVLAEEQRVFDNAGLLDEWEVSMLEDKIQDLRDTYDMDVVLLLFPLRSMYLLHLKPNIL